MGILGLFLTLFVSGILIGVISVVFPNFNADQTQKVGFSNLAGPVQYILAFISLVIVAPITEEVIFRGVLQGQLSKINPWLSIIVVSLLFGLAHGQLNVAVVTFTMGVIMGFIREKITGTIWAPIILHMIKNVIAFYLLFLTPQVLEILTR